MGWSCPNNEVEIIEAAANPAAEVTPLDKKCRLLNSISSGRFNGLCWNESKCKEFLFT